jgi:thioredoxin-dependent peroxiredoxin
MLEPGTVAPEFEVKDQTGQTRRLSDYRGRNVVLWFYPKADTPGWTAEGCGFRDRIKQYEDKGVQVLGASFDTVEAQAAFAKKFDFNFPLLADTERKLGLAYGATDDPKAGYAKRISYLIGPDGKVRKAYPKVNAAAHPEELLKDL